MPKLIRTYINDPRALPLLNRGKAWLRFVEAMPDAYPGNVVLSEAARNSLANRTLVGEDGSVLRTARGPINFASAWVPSDEQVTENRERRLADYYMATNVYDYDSAVLLGVVYAPIDITGAGLVPKTINQAEWRFVAATDFPGGVVPAAIEYNLGGDAASRFATTWQRCADRGTGFLFTAEGRDFYEIMPSSRQLDGRPFFDEEVAPSVLENLSEATAPFPENFTIPGVPYYDEYWYSEGSIDPLGELHGQLKTGIASILGIVGSQLTFFINGGYKSWQRHQTWMIQPNYILIPYSMSLGSVSGSVVNTYQHITKLKVGIINPLDLGVWFEKSNVLTAALSFPNAYENWWWTYLTAAGEMSGDNAKISGSCGWRVDDNHYGLAYFIEHYNSVQYAGAWNDTVQEALIEEGFDVTRAVPINNQSRFFLVGGYDSSIAFYGVYDDGPPKRSTVEAVYEINGARVPIFIVSDRENSVVVANDKRYYMHTETNGMVFSVMDVRAPGGLCCIAIADQRGNVCGYMHTRTTNRPAVPLTTIEGQTLYMNATTPGLRLLKSSARR